MRPLPLRFRRRADGTLFVNDAGAFFSSTDDFLRRHHAGELTARDTQFLAAHGHAIAEDGNLSDLAHRFAVAQRRARPGPLEYLILVPTLRCNLSCSYCQVSRASLASVQHDWSESTLAAVLELIDRLPGPRLKIEFQGGEPLLRPDLIREVIMRAEARFPDASFVVCTNLSRLDATAWALLDRPNVSISTSLDGDRATHEANRTGHPAETDRFLANLAQVIKRFGPRKVSALPTVNYRAPPPVDALIDAFLGFGLSSIYLRAVSFHGFARKRHAYSRAATAAWNDYYASFIRRLIERNWADRSTLLEEYYFTLCLRRIFQPGIDHHVDLRNPNHLGHDYIVIDHDGRVYPTDEARMVTRSGIIDLAIGHVSTGWDTPERAALDAANTNSLDADCRRCAYQPYCGRDIIDDIARYGRIDLPRHQTAFCERHMAIFDLAFELIYSPDAATQYSLRRWLGLAGDSTLLGEVYDDTAEPAGFC